MKFVSLPNDVTQFSRRLPFAALGSDVRQTFKTYLKGDKQTVASRFLFDKAVHSFRHAPVAIRS